MKKRIYSLIGLLSPLLLTAQQSVRSPFRIFDNWDSVLATAKNEKKILFIDAFTTWCAPCKQMDKEVYQNTKVINLLDSSFISVKVQMDQTSKDDEVTKKWYSDAKLLTDKYNIQSFPSLIFLNSDGKIIQIYKGFHSVSSFIGLLRRATDTKESFYHNIAAFKSGNISAGQLLTLALTAREYNEDSLALAIAAAYKKNYLDKKSLSLIINSDLLTAIGSFGELFSLSDPIITFSYKHPSTFDSLVNRPLTAQTVSDFYITRDIVQPLVDHYIQDYENCEPKWDSIELITAKKFDERTARRLILEQKINYYRQASNWQNIAKYEVEKIEFSGIDTAGMGKTAINNLVYEIFVSHIVDTNYLNKALTYMKTILATEPERDAWIDTYANLLYKLGQTKEAIIFQQQALHIARKNNYASRIKDYKQTLEKMRAGKPTWPAEEKPSLTDSSYKTWPKVSTSSLSPNGKYASYIESNPGIQLQQVTLVATNNSWKKSFASAQSPVFSTIDDHAYISVNKQLLRIRLSTDEVDTIANANNFELAIIQSKEYLLYINTDNVLHLYSTRNNKIIRFRDVTAYYLSKKSGAIAYLQQPASNKAARLNYFQIQHQRHKFISDASNISNVVFDASGSSIAFAKNAEGYTTLWVYAEGMQSARQVLSDSALSDKLLLSEFFQFSMDGKRLIYTLQKPLLTYKDTNAPDIWSWEDKILYAKFKANNYQYPSLYHFGENLSAVDIQSGKVVRIARINEHVLFTMRHLKRYVILESFSSDSPGPAMKHYVLYDLANDERITIKLNSIKGLTTYYFSPDQRWLIYYDADNEQWMCYDNVSKRNQAFAVEIMDKLHPYNIARRSVVPGSLDIFGWIDGTDQVVMQGTFDLWRVSVLNKRLAENLTLDGEQKNTVYSVADKPRDQLFTLSSDIYIKGHHLSDQKNSLYRLRLNIQRLDLLMHGDFFWSPLYLPVSETYFQQSAVKGSFLFAQPSAKQSTNFYFTKDFKHIDTLSDCHPEKKVNWLQSELVQYRDAKGHPCQAILYKPDNFDSTKKYPVIFSIYAEQAQRLNEALNPDLPGAEINVPYMVSNGYLVCKPDMYLAKEKIGEYVMLSMHAVLDHLFKLAYIDTSQIGLIGHSFGGWEVNHIITQTDRFTAAVTSGGPSSLINTYNDTWEESGDDKHGIVVDGSFWMGTSLERAKAAYIANTPILNAEKITSPLLIVHNEEDGYSQFYHSLQLFSHLRNMQKKVWLISYPGEGHQISEERNQFDYQKRVKSFFDHYLKSSAKPAWMTKHLLN